MRLHISVIDKLISIYETYGGHRNETKLKNALSEVDLSEYTRANSGETILVLSDDLQREQGARGQ